MPFTIERNDMARVSADAIVITANEDLRIEGGVGLAVARAAGLPEMQAACNALGGCPTGHAVATPAFALSADYVVHVVGPVWQGGEQGEEELLRQAYDSALACADECGARSIALPLVSAHTFGFPVRISFVIAVQAIKAFLEDHDETDVRLVLYGEDAFAVGLSFYDNIAQYIDAHYVEESRFQAYERRNAPSASRRRRKVPSIESEQACPPALSQGRPPRGRRSPFGVVGSIIEGAQDLVSELRDRKHDKPAQGSCVVREEPKEVPEGPYLSPEQFESVQEAAEEASWRKGVCPHCGTKIEEGMLFCLGCGRSVPQEVVESQFGGAAAASPDDTCQMASIKDDAGKWDTVTVFEPFAETAGPCDHDFVSGHEKAEAVLGEEPEAFWGTDSLSGMRPEPEIDWGFGQSSAKPSASAAGPAGGSLSSWLDQLDAPFSTTLLALIDARGLTDAQVYKRANMSRQLFSKIRSDAAYRPTKKTVLALAIALGLDLGETTDLLRRAGFALSHSNKADVIVEYFIVNGNHDIFDINEALYAFDQPLL